MESSDFVYNYTGKISKAILLTEVPELEHFFKPFKGFFKQLRVSPPINRGKAAIPLYISKVSNGKVTYELVPVTLRGDYEVEIGLPASIADKVHDRFKHTMGVKTRLKFENAVITYIIEDIKIEEPRILLNNVQYVVIKTLSPALLPNPLVPNQQIRRFSSSPGVVLWIPRLISDGILTSVGDDARRRYLELEECLAEHYSTRHRIMFLNYDSNREPAIMIRAKYILAVKDNMTRARCIELLEKTLTVARIYGIGASRPNGFGTIIVEKRPNLD